MKIINVNLGTAPNGVKVWAIGYDSNIAKDKTCATSIEKPYFDSITKKTTSNEEYWYEVAKYACSMLEEKLKDKNEIYNFEFICNGTCFRKMK